MTYSKIKFPPQYNYLLYFTLGKKDNYSNEILGQIVDEILIYSFSMPRIDVLTNYRISKNTDHILTNLLKCSGLEFVCNKYYHNKLKLNEYWRTLKPSQINEKTRKAMYNKLSKLKIKEIVTAYSLMGETIFNQSLLHWFKEHV